jgi:hypothetical protein
MLHLKRLKMLNLIANQHYQVSNIKIFLYYYFYFIFLVEIGNKISSFFGGSSSEDEKVTFCFFFKPF